MIDWQIPDLFPNQKDVISSISFSITPESSSPGYRIPANAGSTTLATISINVRDEDKWENVGKVVGGVVGAIVYSLTAPVTLIDGPLPFVDAAWLFGLGRFTYSASQQGGRVGEFVDDVLIPNLS